MVTRDDAWELTHAITGGKRATEDVYLSDIVGMIKDLREDRDHLLNQLAAALQQLDVMAGKRAYATSPWLRNDVETLRRILALYVPTWLEGNEETESEVT